MSTRSAPRPTVRTGDHIIDRSDHDRPHAGHRQRPAARPATEGAARGHAVRASLSERREPRGDAGRGEPTRRHRAAGDDDRGVRLDGQRGDRPVDRARRHASTRSRRRPTATSIKIRLIRPTGTDDRPVRVLHPRRRHADVVLLRRDVPRLGQDDRRPGRGGRDGRLPQRADAVVGARGRAVPGRPQRLRVRPEVAGRQRRRARHRRRATS